MFRTALLFAAVAVSLCTTVPPTRVNFLANGRLEKSQITSGLKTELGLSDRDLAEIEEGVRHLFVSMPKNAHGNLGHKAIRQALHRFFVNRYGWWLRGFELDVQHESGAEDKDRVPELLQEAFEGMNMEMGADLHALAALVATVELLVRQEAHAHLLDAYKVTEVQENDTLDREVARSITHTYFMSFILEHNWTVDDKTDFTKKIQIFKERYPLYRNASVWLYNVFAEELGAKQTMNMKNAVSVADRIGKEYHDLNDVECGNLREVLQAMESKKPGRVRLAAFYNTSLHSHWKFTENVETLRNLGALDDSDPQQKYVVISNYALARPNCFNASNIYEICCDDICQRVQTTIEMDVNDSMATVDHITRLVSTIATDSVKAPRILSNALIVRLNQVADAHGGYIPLHGRLFKQWLHHAFPLDCSYPHEAGTTNPQAWTGQDSEQATEEEMRQHVAADTCTIDASGKVNCAEESAEIPWSDTEELLVVGPISPTSRPEGDKSLESITGCCLLVLALLALALGARRGYEKRRIFPMSGTLALAGLASLLGLLDPTVAVVAAVGGAIGNFAADRSGACQPSKGPATGKGV